MASICKTCGEFVKDDKTGTCSKGHQLGSTSARSVAAKAKVATNANWGTIVRDDFKKPGSELKNANRKVLGIFHFQSPSAVDIPGTGYDVVCPCQSYVKPSIVKAKIEFYTDNKSAVPVIAVIYGNDGVLRLAGDGHHSFVAAIKAQVMIELQLVDFGLKYGPTTWKSTTWNEFAENPSAAKGTKVKVDIPDNLVATT